MMAWHYVASKGYWIYALHFVDTQLLSAQQLLLLYIEWLDEPEYKKINAINPHIRTTSDIFAFVLDLICYLTAISPCPLFTIWLITSGGSSVGSSSSFSSLFVLFDPTFVDKKVCCKFRKAVSRII